MAGLFLKADATAQNHRFVPMFVQRSHRLNIEFTGDFNDYPWTFQRAKMEDLALGSESKRPVLPVC